MEYRNPQFNHLGTIDVEINHPAFGWIPFTASPDDPEEHGRLMFEQLASIAAPFEKPAE